MKTTVRPTIPLRKPSDNRAITPDCANTFSNSVSVRAIRGRSQDSAERLAHLQALISEGLQSGLSDLSVQDVIAQADQIYDNDQILRGH